MPTLPIRPLVWSFAPGALSLFRPLHQPRESTSFTATRALAGPAPPPSPSAIALDRPASEIIPSEAAVVIVVDATDNSVIGHGGFQLKLARRLMLVETKGVLAEWRVQCEVPTLITQNDT